MIFAKECGVHIPFWHWGPLPLAQAALLWSPADMTGRPRGVPLRRWRQRRSKPESNKAAALYKGGEWYNIQFLEKSGRWIWNKSTDNPWMPWKNDEKRAYSHNMRSWGRGTFEHTEELEKKMMDLISQCLDNKVLASWLSSDPPWAHGPVQAEYS